jgi:uncharacterized SAM-binding protein YcdF (DUF218 family)
MFLLSKLVDHLILPPGLFIAVSIFCLVLLFLRKNSFARIVLLVNVALFYVLAIEPVKDFLLFPLENRYPPLEEENNEQLSAIVVLGGGIVCNSPEERGRTSLASDSLKRVVYGKLLHEAYGLPIIVSAGNVVKVAGCEPEAWAAKRVLLSLGVRADQVFMEDESRNTWENARYIEEKYKPVSVLLVTSAYHMKRSVYCFEKHNIRCLPAPTDYKANRAGYSYRSFFPSMGSFSGSYTALKEYVGWVYYRLRYG